MSSSKLEEIIAALWAIAGILCFGFGFESCGIGFSAMAIYGLFCCIREVEKEIRRERFGK